MKLAFTVKVPEKSESFKDFEGKVEYLAKIGYDGVELAIRDPKEINAEKVKKIIDNFGLKVPTISTGEAYTTDGLSLSNAKPERATNAAKRIKSQIKLAAKFNSKVTIGLIRGKLDELRPEKSQRSFFTTMNTCDTWAGENNVYLLLEPLNRYETNFINTIEEADAFILKSELKNTRILADTFHMNIEEKSIDDTIFNYWYHISHVHIADNNRLAPGMGHLDFKTIFHVLKIIDVGCEKFITAEIILEPSFETAAWLALNYLKNIMLSLGGADEK